MFPQRLADALSANETSPYPVITLNLKTTPRSNFQFWEERNHGANTYKTATVRMARNFALDTLPMAKCSDISTTDQREILDGITDRRVDDPAIYAG